MPGNFHTPQKRALPKGLWTHFAVYGTSLALLMLAIPLGIQAGLPYAVASLLLAALSFVSVKHVLEQKVTAEREKELQYRAAAAVAKTGCRRGIVRRHRP